MQVLRGYLVPLLSPNRLRSASESACPELLQPRPDHLRHGDLVGGRAPDGDDQLLRTRAVGRPVLGA
eukprot:1924642-Pyramimonas_sp.AAC.1